MVSDHRPRILGHRGASGSAPENSLEAFRLARDLGADGIELDVHATADGALVVYHDPDLPAGRIRELPLSEVRESRLPNGEAIPTLEEALDAVPDLEVWIEVKALDPDLDGGLLEVITTATAPERCAVHSFDHRLIARLHRRAPELRLGLLTVARLLEPVRALEQAGATTLWQERQLIDRELVEVIHAAGRAIVGWTVNEIAEARRLAALGLDALCGDWPERLQ